MSRNIVELSSQSYKGVDDIIHKTIKQNLLRIFNLIVSRNLVQIPVHRHKMNPNKSSKE